MPSSSDHPLQLSVYRAFVIQFDATTMVKQSAVGGRVEHIVSGQAMNFQSLETLMAFISDIAGRG